MKFIAARFTLLVSIILLLAAASFGQASTYARRIWPVTALPALCNPLNGEVVTLTVGPGTGVYNCTSVNVWTPIGTSASGQLLINQGILTGSFPFLNHTATWNNGAVTFTNFISNVTNTASNANSKLFQWQVGGNDVFSGNALGQFAFTQPTLTASLPFINHTVTWNNGAVAFVDDFRNITATASAAASMLAQWQVGGINQFALSSAGTLQTNNYYAADAGIFSFGTTRSIVSSDADGRLKMTNSAGTVFGRLDLGSETVASPAIQVSAAIGGQTQGIIIGKADGSVAIFGDLGAAANGSMIYCSTCTLANPCAGGGTGAIAKRLNGVWICN